jgi:TonB family protein
MQVAAVAPTERPTEAATDVPDAREASRPQPVTELTNRAPEAARVAAVSEAAAIAAAQGVASLSPEPQAHAAVTDSTEQREVRSASTPASALAPAETREAKVDAQPQPAAEPPRDIAATEVLRSAPVQAETRPPPEAAPAAIPRTVRESRPSAETALVATTSPQVEPRTTRESPRRTASLAPVPRDAQPKRAEDDRGAPATNPSSRGAPASARASVASPGGAAASADYRALVVAELNRRKFYPPAARQAGIEGVVMVAFTVGASGRVTQHSITRPSGHAALDSAVHQMMGQVGLPPPPGGTFRAMVPIRFNLAY